MSRSFLFVYSVPCADVTNEYHFLCILNLKPRSIFCKAAPAPFFGTRVCRDHLGTLRRVLPCVCACAAGVKQSVCLSVRCLSSTCHLSSVVCTKIARSRHLGISATRKYNESIGLGKKLASVCFKSRDMIHEHHK
jgi:hypothetical protein